MPVEARKFNYQIPRPRCDALNNLVQLQYQLANQYQINNDLSEWLLKGLEALLTGSSDTLDSALGLEGKAGIAKAGTRFRKHHRDLGLLNMMAMIRNPDESDWQLAIRAAAEITKFETVTWRRISELPEPPERLNETQRILWHLFQIDQSPPCSATFLFGLLRQPPLLTVVEVINN